MIKYLLILTFFFSGIYANAQKDTTFYIFFDNESSHLSSKEIKNLNHFIKTLHKGSITEMRVVGYTDNIGSKSYNQNLSQKRADVIKDYLLSMKFSPAIIKEVRGKGSLPINDQADMGLSEQRAYNRRVEISVYYPHKKEENKILTSHQKVGDKITLRNVLFEGGTHRFLPESYTSLKDISNSLSENKKYQIKIMGHICCTMNGEDGVDMETGRQDLSLERAKTVYNYLVAQGIDSNRMKYVGLAGKFPTGKGPYYDRRVEIEITGVK